MAGWNMRDCAARWRCWDTLSTMRSRAATLSEEVVATEVVVREARSGGWSDAWWGDGRGSRGEDSVKGASIGRRQSGVLAHESGGSTHNEDAKEEEEEGGGEAEKGSMELARRMFARRYLKNAAWGAEEGILN